MSDLIKRAQDFAHRAHDSINQKRKYSGEPYWTHTDAVAELVASVTNDEVLIAAAHLHDVLEDVAIINPDFGLGALKENFGEIVTGHVVELTDVFVKEAFPHLNRRTRKSLDHQRLGAASDGTKTVKLGDVIHNNADLVKQNPGFARTYLKEKEHLLPYLVGGSPILYERAQRLLAENKKLLGME